MLFRKRWGVAGVLDGRSSFPLLVRQHEDGKLFGQASGVDDEASFGGFNHSLVHEEGVDVPIQVGCFAMHSKDHEWLEPFDHPIGSKRVNPGTFAHRDQQDIDRSDGSRLRLRKNMSRVTEVRDP